MIRPRRPMPLPGRSPRSTKPLRQRRASGGHARPQPWNGVEERPERDLPFQGGGWGIQAVVGSLAEGEVAVGIAGEVQPVRARELPLVPVGGRDHHVDHVSPRDRDAGHQRASAKDLGPLRIQESRTGIP